MPCNSRGCSRNSGNQMANNMGLQLGGQSYSGQPQGKIPKGNGWTGTPAFESTHNLFTPQQYGLQNQALQGAGNLLQGGRNPLAAQFDFGPIADQARESFYSDTVPTLAERFTGMGAGAQGSSDFAGAVGQAGRGLDRDLASLRQQFGLQQQGMNQNLLSNLLSSGLGSRAFETAYHPRQPGFLENAGSRVLGGASEAGSLLLGKYLFGL